MPLIVYLLVALIIMFAGESCTTGVDAISPATTATEQHELPGDGRRAVHRLRPVGAGELRSPASARRGGSLGRQRCLRPGLKHLVSATGFEPVTSRL
jgi:hypothetical protein